MALVALLSRPSPGQTAEVSSDNEAGAATAAAAAGPSAAPRRRRGAGLPQQAVGAGGRGAQQPAYHLEPGAATRASAVGRPAPAVCPLAAGGSSPLAAAVRVQGQRGPGG